MQDQPPALASISLRDLAERLGIDAPETDMEITGLSTIDQAGPTQLAFLQNDRYAERLKRSKAGAVLVPEDFDGEVPMPTLRTKKPRLAFAEALRLFHPEKPVAPGIHATAIVPASCALGADVHIGAYVVLGENVRLGDRVVIHPHCAIYDDAVLGDDCLIHSHVSIRESLTIGARVVVQNGATIGPDGFGFEPDEHGHLQRIPQVGGVEIGDDVDIQANACVDRSALGNTIIGRGVKIDNLAQVAHGCTIGEHSVICGQAGLAGSTELGKHVMLGGQAGCSGHIKVGDGAQISAQAGVIFDLEGNEQYGGTPALPLQTALRAAVFLPKLPEFSKRIKALERSLAKLEQARDA